MIALPALLLAALCGVSAAAAPEGLAIRRYFEAVPEFGLSHACVIEADPAHLKFSAISAPAAAGLSRATALELREKMPGAPVIINAGFFSLKTGAPIGEFVEEGARPGNIIYAPGKNLDRVFVSRYDDSVDVVGAEKLSDTQLLWTRSAVTGKSAWPGHSDATNRTAACLTREGKVLLAAVYPLRTVEQVFAFMRAEGCLPEKILNLDGGGSTQLSFSAGGAAWNLGWERAGAGVPDCHRRGDNRDPRCYRPVANFIVVEPRKRPFPVTVTEE